MNAIAGYVVSGLGIVTLALSSDKIKNNLSIKLLESIPSTYILILGGILLVGGIAILVSSNNTSSSNGIKQAKEEVPIYEGEGKYRKIVGYRKG